MADTSKPALNVKRKRRAAGECPNPLFVRWVEEWRDEAREDGSKVQYAYAKALNSLRKYPLPLTSGQEAKILDHIGEKLAKKLDKRLAEHRAAAEGDPPPITGYGRDAPASGENSGCVKKSKLDPEKEVDTCESATRVSNKGKRKKAPVEYVPEFRSGPYAIIIALCRAQQKPCWIGYLTKSQLMTQAQPHCDKSFTIPDDGKYYTAWSSMATLIRKGLVDKRSCPAKFKLTEAGEEMAERLDRATESLSTTNSHSLNNSLPSDSSGEHSKPPRNSPTQRQTAGPCKPSPTQRQTAGPCKPSPTQRQTAGPCKPSPTQRQTVGSNSPSFSPTTSSGAPAPPGAPAHPATAAVRPTISLVSDSDDSDIEVLLPLTARIRNRNKPPAAHSLSSPPLPGHSGSVSSRMCVEETPVSRDRGRGSGGKRELSLTPAQKAGQAALLRLQTEVGTTVQTGASGSGVGGKGREEGLWKSCRVDLTLEERDHSPDSEKENEEEEFPDFPLCGRKCSPSPKSHSSSALREVTSSVQNTSPHSITSNTASTVPPLFTLRPGDFDVVLCVDSAESTASRKSSSQFRGILLQELAKNGVRFDVRKLNVGDFLWIAKEKTPPLPGQLTLPKSKEVVMEYIVERKRMDDLASSITDGRFHEQKFRLRQCGVRQPMYLVEEFRDKMHLNLPLRSLEQAISNTQVIDGFPVHRTTDIRDSVAYLTLLTRRLCTHYSGKTIQAFAWDSTQLQISSPSSNVVPGVEFESFNEASIKNKPLSAYEMLGRHLMQILCVSAERAAAILDHFPTISALREAYGRCGDSCEREVLISSLKAGQNRSLGKNIGKIMANLYWGQ